MESRFQPAAQRRSAAAQVELLLVVGLLRSHRPQQSEQPPRLQSLGIHGDPIPWIKVYYSARKAVRGSTRVARRTGIQQASSPTIVITATAKQIITGS